MNVSKLLIEAYRLGVFESCWRLVQEGKHKAKNGRCYQDGHQGPVPCGGSSADKPSSPAKMADKPRRPKGRSNPPPPEHHDPRHEALVNTLRERVQRGVRSSGLSNQARRHYQTITTEGLRAMTPKALSRVEANVREVRIYEDHAAFLRHYRQAYPHEEDEPFGYYDNGQIHADGGGSLGARAYVFIHECMHAMDGEPGRALSESEGWRRAHHREIRLRRRLTVPAQETAAEGLATLATDIYTERLSRREAKKLYPGCYRFLEQRGLI